MIIEIRIITICDKNEMIIIENKIIIMKPDENNDEDYDKS
jgi:hypothetical protein